jgi:hypothetical protein
VVLAKPVAGPLATDAARSPHAIKQQMSHWRPQPLWSVLLLLALLLSACVVRDRVQVNAITPPASLLQISSPVKAHLADGSTVVYSGGLTISGGTLVGKGVRYGLDLARLEELEQFPLERVMALESFENRTEKALTFLASTGATVVGLAAAVLVAKALFGSCPTVYSETPDGPALEAELFSYSIAPRFELGDVDRLAAQPDALGALRLEVRNEALETHYVNALELIEARHGAGEIVLPDERGVPLALGPRVSARQAVDRAGRDVRAALRATDEFVFETDRALLANVDAGSLEDHIDLEFAVPPDRASVALHLRLRNSLLNTVLFYDEMLAAAGARSVDYLGRELGQVGPALRLAKWYKSRMGLRVSVREGGRYREIARLADTGPIAWKDVAVMLPATRGDSIQVRLSYVADNWRIDEIGLATDVRRPETRAIAVARVMDGKQPNEAARQSMASADGKYVQTGPGQTFQLVFETGAAAPGQRRTFLLASRGYYIEWIRREWLSGPPRQPFTFRPGDEALVQAIAKWNRTRDEFEAQFHNTKVPIAR